MRRLYQTLFAFALSLLSMIVHAGVQYLPADAGVNGTDFSNCTSTLSSGVYYVDCTGNVILPNGNNNQVELTATPVVLTISGDLTLGGTDINTQGTSSELSIDVGGNLNPGNNGNIINADLTVAGSINAGNNTDISGGLVISGNVNLGNNSTIEGQVQISGDLNTGSNVSITGDVEAGGNLNVGQNNNITGDISADTININGSNTVITGDVQAEGNLNNNGTIYGNVNVSGDLNNNGVIEGGYVNATCTDTNSCGGTINVDQTCNTDSLDDNTSACAGSSDTSIHSFLVSHSGTALTCEAFPITVTACANANCSQTVSGTGSATVNVGSFSQSITFSNSATAQASLNIVTAGNYNVSLTNVSGFVSSNPTQFSPSNQVTAVDTALRFTGEQPQLAAANFVMGLEAIRTDNDTGACVAAFNTTKTVNFDRVCDDPTLCSEAIQINNTAVTSNSDVTVDFTNGSASLALNYPDVGRIRLIARATGDTNITLSGTSQAFVVKPWGIEFVVGTGSLGSNTAGSQASYADDAVFERAGTPFTVDIAAVMQNGVVPPSFGQESTPETIEISGHNLLAPNSDANNTANSGTLDVIGNQVSFSEVGVIELIAGLTDNDYLGAGDIPLINRTSQPVGRFIPDRFVQTNGELLGACNASNFYYMGQPQAFAVQLMAVNVDGNLTQNYFANFAKATPEFYSFDSNDPNTATALNRLADLQGDLEWQNGMSAWQNTTSGNPTVVLERQADGSPDGHYPDYTLAWQIDDGEQDSGGNAAYYTTIESSPYPGVAGANAIDSIALYYGRLALDNVSGAVDQALAIQGRVEFYQNDGRFVANTNDNCTVVVADAFSDAVSSTDLAAERLPADDNYQQTVVAGELYDINGMVDDQLRWIQPDLLRGRFLFELQLGAVGLGLEHLQFDWDNDNSFTDNPQAEGIFGIYRGSDRQIYWRELGW